MWRTAASLQLRISGGEVICCVPSEGICLCLVPSQDSRRERSNNFQAFVKMALETLLGSCRRKHGAPRGRQGWEGPRFPPLNLHTGLLYGRFPPQRPVASHRGRLWTRSPSPSVVQPLPPPTHLFPSPPPPPHAVQVSLLAAPQNPQPLQVKPDHCFELKKRLSPSLIEPHWLCNSPKILVNIQQINSFL